MGYGTDMTKAVAGMQADSGNSYNESGKVAKEQVDFGIGVVKGTASHQLREAIQDVSNIIFDAVFVTSNVINMKINNVDVASQTFTTDQATTAEALRVKILALASVTACTFDATSKTYTVTTLGVPAIVTDVAVTAGSTQAGSTLAVGSTDLFRGVALQIHNEDGVYADGDAVTFKRQGRVWVPVSESVLEDASAYIDMSDSDKRMTDDSTNGLAVPTGVFRSEDENGLALLEINLP